MNAALTGHPKVDAVAHINFEGNITPKSWFKHIVYRTPKGETKVDRLAINILADIVYWYRPYEKRHELTGEVIGWCKKFKEDMLRRSPEAFAEVLNSTARCIKESMKVLEKLGLISVVNKPVYTQYGCIPNVMHIDIMPEAIASISYRPNFTQDAETLDKSLLTKWVSANTEPYSENTESFQPDTEPYSGSTEPFQSDTESSTHLYIKTSLENSLKTSPKTSPPIAPQKARAVIGEKRGAEEEFAQEAYGDKSDTKGIETQPLVTNNDSRSPQIENSVLGEDKNSAVVCDNSAFVGRGNIAPDGKSRPFNQFTARWHSVSSDPWMKSACNPKDEFKKWVCDRALAKGNNYSLSDAAGEIRNNFQRASDLWEEYLEHQEKTRLTQTIKEQASLEEERQHKPQQTVVAEASPSEQGGKNPFLFYRSAIRNQNPLFRNFRERGIEWAQNQQDVVLVRDEQSGEVIDIKEIEF